MPLAANEWAEMDKELASRERTLRILRRQDGTYENLCFCYSPHLPTQGVRQSPPRHHERNDVNAQIRRGMVSSHRQICQVLSALEVRMAFWTAIVGEVARIFFEVERADKAEGA